MVIFKIESLKDFQKRTQYIKPNTTLPALGFVKLEYKEGKHYLTKNNLRCVCVSLVSGEGECPDLLLDDRIFFGFLSKAKNDTIKIKWDDSKVFISDGKSVVEFPKEDVTNFPKTPDYSQTKTTFIFKKEHLDSISIAKNFLTNTDTAGNFKFVHIGGEFISAFHTNYFYVNNKFADLPNMIIDLEIADVITAGEQFEVGVVGNQYFFLCNNVVYIFTQEEGKTPNIKTSVWDRLQRPGKEFQFAKENLTDFIDLSNIVSDSELVDCLMYQNGTNLMLTLKDNNKNRSNTKVSAMVGQLDNFKFDARLVSAPFKSIPYETFKSKMVENCLIISEATGKEYFCFMGLQL